MTRFSRATWLSTALGASVALNLVLGGLLVFAPKPQGRRPDLATVHQQMEKLVPEADRARFTALLDAGRPGVLAQLDRQRAARATAEEALGQEPFDPASLRAAMARARNEYQQFSIALEDNLIDAVSTLSPEGRRRLAEDSRRRREAARRARGDN
ncbi:periplasmic heavy metal sensor [Roseomonas sp. 18066]|uniref:periplasmic heavy metal sensor n=1 Tax=Roseomonas sp. 18066 TaxID=2681412 RepID=UPI0013598F94|nr:periplasmic heavy metal sensor [Roseomonas sp. 18066]